VDDAIRSEESNNHLLPAITGLRLQLDQVAQLLDERGTSTTLSLDNPLVLAALGLLSSRQTLNRWLRDCEHPVRDNTSPSHINESSTDFRILR